MVMLINKIQSPEDMAEFINASGEQVERMLKDTPDHLLDTIGKVMRTLLYSMELPEEKTESMVSMVKERKIVRLFENVRMNMDDVREALLKRAEIRNALMEKFLLTEEEAKDEYKKVIEED